MTDLTLKCFTDSGCMAYLVGCRKTGRALLVDPKVGKRELYESAAQDFGLTIAAVLDTHTHADHLSDSAAWVKRGVELWMSARTACARKHRALKQGDEVRAGELRFRVSEVPGHTDDSIALHGHGLVLCGDTLLAGGLARSDFRGSDPARLFESVKRELLSLPDGTVVLSGHGYRDVLFTTIGHERARNPALQFESAGAYALSLNAIEGAGNSPEVDATLATNLEADPELPDSPATVAACCAHGTNVDAAPGAAQPVDASAEELAWLRESFVTDKRWFDVRDPHEYRAGHVAGALSYPLSELGFHLDELRRTGPAVLSCRSGVRSMTAARTLAYLGVLDQPLNLTGGFLRWQELGLPVEG